MVNVLANGGDELFDARKGTPTNPLHGQFPKPALQEVQPGAEGGREVQVKARMASPAGSSLVSWSLAGAFSPFSE